jgi:hypothetical protein
MTRIKRPSPTHAWLDGYRPKPSLEAACEALEQRLHEGHRRPFADAPRFRFEEIDAWAL